MLNLILFILSCVPIAIAGITCPLITSFGPCKCSSAGNDISCSTVRAINLREIFRHFHPTAANETFQLHKFSLTGGDYHKKAQLIELQDNTFQGFHFEEIVIRLTRIDTIHPDSFADTFHHTKRLRLDHDNLHSKDIASKFEPLTIISKFSRLEELDLSGNQLTVIPSEVFTTLQTSLRVIKLSFNHIHSVGDRAFSGLKNLRSLQLNSNRIQSVGENSLFPFADFYDDNDHSRKTRSLQVNLFDNRLSSASLTNLTFSLLRTPMKLRLNFNNITDIEESKFKPIFENSGSIELHYNHINCMPCGPSSWILEQDHRKSFCHKCKCSSGVHFYSQPIDKALDCR